MTTYAKDTTVPVDRSRAEIEAALKRYGCDQFVYGWDRDEHRAVLGFRIHGRNIRLQVPLPQEDDPQFITGSTNQHARKGTFNKAAFEQAQRQRWRAMLLYVKATLEAVQNGLVAIDDAFLYAVVLPNNQTLKQWAQPQLAEIYASGDMPRLLPGPAAEEQ